MNLRVRRKWLYRLFFQRKIWRFSQIFLDSNQERRFIRCPDCGKHIIEGIAFCAWCGFHLRRFERYQLE